jgi:excinuclease ABC subunit A
VIASTTWEGLLLPELLRLTVGEAAPIFARSEERLATEIRRRLGALQEVGLGYVELDRPAPTLSRGESQRLRLALTLVSPLENLLHVLDEPTIGQHARDVARLLPVLRRLPGPVVYVEHDRAAVAEADFVLDLGPGGGPSGGRVVFAGAPEDLWAGETATGRYFSRRERVTVPAKRPNPDVFLSIGGAILNNLKGIDAKLALGRLNVVSGVSGAGKSSLVSVVCRSLAEGRPVGCSTVDGPSLKPLLVDQSPIGANPRSSAATYCGLAGVVRDLFAAETDLSPSHFSFNRPEGKCEVCGGMGAVEVKLRYLPSTWLPCAACEGTRFSEEVRKRTITLGTRTLAISDLYSLSVSELRGFVGEALETSEPGRRRLLRRAQRILGALQATGLGYLVVGQASPTLSGGEAQRVKLARALGKGRLEDRLIVLDEPSTGLHPADIQCLVDVLDHLVCDGATIVVVEHNLDLIRAADWVVDLGPGAGPGGGQIVYQGPLPTLVGHPSSETARALESEEHVSPSPSCVSRKGVSPQSHLEIVGAKLNNLKNVNVRIPRNRFTVVSGVSGSGKSSLVLGVIETEARRRFLETLSLYERQGVRERSESDADAVRGLGVAATLGGERRLFERRSTVGSTTGIAPAIAVLLSLMGHRRCLSCGGEMQRGRPWRCTRCEQEAPFFSDAHFVAANYVACCTVCHGVGTLQQPAPEKLIVRTDLPLCAGAMHSPGFFPQGYLCKPGNGGYDLVRGLADRYGFEPEETPWREMSSEARRAFLFGDPQPMQVVFRSHGGRTTVRTVKFPGFYGWVGEWDVGGTYTRTVTCPDCRGARLRPESLAFTLNGLNMGELSAMPLDALDEHLSTVSASRERPGAASALGLGVGRTRFLRQIGLGYLTLDRLSATLSAGEAQRIRIATLLGGDLAGLTLLLDEPSRGMHPREVGALVEALRDLRASGNTVIVVEHDPQVIRAADHVVELGPGSGLDGGRIVAEGPPADLSPEDSITARYLTGTPNVDGRLPREATAWMIVEEPTENNLACGEVRIPLGVMVGLCGPSGSGKSTLAVDILSRALAPRKHTTSVAQEPVVPGAHGAIRGAPAKTVVVDQSRREVKSPVDFLGLARLLRRLYERSEEAVERGLGEKQFLRGCSACKGRGIVRQDMGFLPDLITPCDACDGSGFLAEAFEVMLRGYALPDLYSMTVSRVRELWSDEPSVANRLSLLERVGLGYLALRQPRHQLSGGECQRIKMAAELSQGAGRKAFYILDEPTLGQHEADVRRLETVLQELTDSGAGVLIVEHHPWLLSRCDWLIELGPSGGPTGGRIVAAGPPAAVAFGSSASAPFLRSVMGVVE